MPSETGPGLVDMSRSSSTSSISAKHDAIVHLSLLEQSDDSLFKQTIMNSLEDKEGDLDIHPLRRVPSQTRQAGSMSFSFSELLSPLEYDSSKLISLLSSPFNSLDLPATPVLPTTDATTKGTISQDISKVVQQHFIATERKTAYENSKARPVKIDAKTSKISEKLLSSMELYPMSPPSPSHSSVSNTFPQTSPASRIKIPVSNDPDRVPYSVFAKTEKPSSDTFRPKKKIQKTAANEPKLPLGVLHGKVVKSKINTWRSGSKTKDPPSTLSETKKLSSSLTSPQELGSSFLEPSKNSIDLLTPPQKDTPIHPVISPPPTHVQSFIPKHIAQRKVPSVQNKYQTLPTKIRASVNRNTNSFHPTLSPEETDCTVIQNAAQPKSSCEIEIQTSSITKPSANSMKSPPSESPKLPFAEPVSNTFSDRLEQEKKFQRLETMTSDLWSSLIKDKPLMKTKPTSNEKVHRNSEKREKKTSVESLNSKNAKSMIKQQQKPAPIYIPIAEKPKQPPFYTMKYMSYPAKPIQPNELKTAPFKNANSNISNESILSTISTHTIKTTDLKPEILTAKMKKFSLPSSPLTRKLKHPNPQNSPRDEKETTMQMREEKGATLRNSKKALNFVSLTASGNTKSHRGFLNSHRNNFHHPALSISTEVEETEKEQCEETFSMLYRVQRIVSPPSDLIYLGLLLLYILFAFDCLTSVY